MRRDAAARRHAPASPRSPRPADQPPGGRQAPRALEDAGLLERAARQPAARFATGCAARRWRRPRAWLREAEAAWEGRLGTAQGRRRARRLTGAPACSSICSLNQVGGEGKPVRIRRGPATVTGDAHRGAPVARSHCPPRSGIGKARRGRPGSQETCLRPKPTSPRGKGWLHAHVSSHLTVTLLAGCPLASPARRRRPLAAGDPATVTVRVEGFNADAARRRRRSRPTTRPCQGRQRGTRAPARAPLRRALGRHRRQLERHVGEAVQAVRDRRDRRRTSPVRGTRQLPTGRSGLDNDFASVRRLRSGSTSRATTSLFFRQLLPDGACPADASALPLGTEAPAARARHVGESVAVTVTQLPAAKRAPRRPPPARASTGAAERDAGRQRQCDADVLDARHLHAAGQRARLGPHRPTTICVHAGNDGDCGTDGRARPTGSAASAGVSSAQPLGAYKGPFALVADATGLIDGHVYCRGSRAADARRDGSSRTQPSPRSASSCAAATAAAAPPTTAPERALPRARAAAAASFFNVSQPAAASPTCCPSRSRPAATCSTSRPSDAAGNTHGPRARHLADRLLCPLERLRRGAALASRWRAPRPRSRRTPARRRSGGGGRERARHGRRPQGGSGPRRTRTRHRARATVACRRAALRRRGGHAAGGAGRRCAALGGPALRAARLRALRLLAAQLGPAVRVLARRRDQPRPERLGVQGRRRRRARPARPTRAARTATGGCCAPASGCCGSGAGLRRRLSAHPRSLAPPAPACARGGSLAGRA